jgi:hypothetical protein
VAQAKRATEGGIIPARKKNPAERLVKSADYIYLAHCEFYCSKEKYAYFTDDFRNEKDSFIHSIFNVLPIIRKLTGVG